MFEKLYSHRHCNSIPAFCGGYASKPPPPLSPLTEDVENRMKELGVEIAVVIISPPLHATVSKLTQRGANVAETREAAAGDISRIRRGINAHKIQSWSRCLSLLEAYNSFPHLLITEPPFLLPLSLFGSERIQFHLQPDRGVHGTS